MTVKSEHEDEAFEDLLHLLRSQGDQVSIASQPDRDLSDPLTVDAMLLRNGELIAVDHCLLSRPPELPRAMERAESELGRLLLPIAAEYECHLLVTFRPQVGAQGEKWGADYYPLFTELAYSALSTGEPAHLSDGFGEVKVLAAPEGLGPGVSFIHEDDSSRSALIADQVDAGVRQAVMGKLKKQLRRAKEAGHRTGLLVDQQPRPGGNSAVWPAGPETVAAVIRNLMSEHEKDAAPVLDFVWMRRTRRVDDERCEVQWLLGQP